MSDGVVASRPRRLVIFAHYDPAGGVDEHVLELLRQLKAVAQDIVVVSTGLSAQGRLRLEPFGVVLEKPNLGYDFGSWRHGLDYARRNLDLSAYEAVIISNDSVYALRDDVFGDAFAAMAGCTADIWGMTLSHQPETHLQSYFVVFRRPAFLSRWFHRFWSSVWDYGDRAFVIARYEMGLSTTARQAGLVVDAVFDAKRVKAISTIDHHLNPTHRLWRHVARELGIAKVELLARNPHSVEIAELPALATPAALERIKAHSGAIAPPAAARVTPRQEAAQWAQRSNAAVAVHIHLHFAELVDELMLAARNLPMPADIFVTVTDRRNLDAIVGRIKAHSSDARILLVDNRGRDIFPFLELLEAGVFAPYAAVCKIHSKRSTYSEHGAAWRQQLMAPLLGSSSAALNVLAAFRQWPELGLVVPTGAFVRDPRHWGGNRQRVETLARRLDATYGTGRTPLAFPAGSMYWFRPGALEPLRRLGLTKDDFEPERGAQDGTLAHVVERLIALSCWAAGYAISETDDLSHPLTADGVDRSLIPVL